MATDSVVATQAPPIDHSRNLWQLPVLLLGIAVFVCEWQGWLPSTGERPETGHARDIATLKATYEKVAVEPTELKTLLNKVAANVEAYPLLAPQARFHLGSGYVRLAEITTAQDESQGYWVLAHQHFELVREKDLRDPVDASKLTFRAAKARAMVALPPDASNDDILALIAILGAQQSGEEAGEAHRIIAELALRLNPPDISRAKVALTRYLETTGISTPSASLARGRLRLAELYLRENDYIGAQKWLAEIGPDAPPDVAAPAKVYLARVFMALGNPTDAARVLEMLRGMPGVPPPLRLGATYQLGVCKLKLQLPDASARLFEEVAKSDSVEAAAAAIQLADLRLHAADPKQHKTAVDLLASAMKGITSAASYEPISTLIPLNDAQAVFELAVTTLLADSAYDEALQVAEKYAVIATPGRDREKRADILGAWGEAIQKAKSGDPKPKFKAAADEFAALAAFQPKTAGKINMLRRAASFSRLANDPFTAANRLEEAAKLPDIPEQTMSAVWVELADALLAAGRSKEVYPLFNKVMATQTPLSTATTYRLARVFVDSRHPGLVETGRALFGQIANKKNVEPSEQEYHERSLTELANALIREGKFADAEYWLRMQIDLHRTGPEAPLARLLLGVCLLQRAAAPNVPEVEATKLRNEALVNFKQIVKDCDDIERRNRKLNEREAWLRLQAALRVLQAYQQMKNPAELLAEAAPLLDRHKGTVEELIILSLVYHAFRQMNQPGKALDTRDRMREAFDVLPPSAFPQDKGEYSREYWQTVWFAPEKK